MDARLDPAGFLGLEEGDAHVIRNAGGPVTDDALRSLVISHWLPGTQEAFVIGHSDCGMLTFTNEQLHAKLAEETGADASGGRLPAAPELDESVPSQSRSGGALIRGRRSTARGLHIKGVVEAGDANEHDERRDRR